MTATRASPGTRSLSSSSRFALRSRVRVLTPVMFPPGRPRLATNPSAMGSKSSAMTIGIVDVMSLAARVAKGPPVTITSTPSRTSSAACAWSRSTLPALHRYSRLRFVPSTYPNSRSPCTNPSQLAVQGPGEMERYTTRGRGRGRCAAEASGPPSRLRVSVTMHPTALHHMVVSSSRCYAALRCARLTAWHDPRLPTPGRRGTLRGGGCLAVWALQTALLARGSAHAAPYRYTLFEVWSPPSHRRRVGRASAWRSAAIRSASGASRVNSRSMPLGSRIYSERQ